ncbi:MAG: DUF4080 domain-containing protein [Bdellovibrionaceae bacterium]|nr:DUF4080 domain-containing protein [Pseudobdellovibrionaceae bacterium]
MRSEILLVTLNSTYQHSSVGLRYLHANLQEFSSRSEILELTINQNPRDMAEKILIKAPKLVGFGVYIWNTKITEEVIRILRAVNSDLLVVLGGPEVSHEAQGQSIVELCDYVIQGEGDLAFYDFCKKWSEGQLPPDKIIKMSLPELSNLRLPYREYSDEDIQNRVIYVEASRGCPFRCEYCLSSLDKSVRNFPIDQFLGEIQILLDRGAKQFKFVDRTFNLSPSISHKILAFFLKQIDLGLFLHFEMVPDRLPDGLKSLIEQFPKGSLQFEIGIQTWNPAVAALVSRKQDFQLISQNLKYLREHTAVHTHADLIVGLPGETLSSFGSGFDALVALQPDEIQVGLLKSLKGTPIVRHNVEFKMVYQKEPPFQILQNKDLTFFELQRAVRFAKFWDLYGNSGHFLGFIEALKLYSTHRDHPSFFWEFFEFLEFIETRHAESHGISLINLFETAWNYLNLKWPEKTEYHRNLLIADLLRDKKRDIPKFLRPFY